MAIASLVRPQKSRQQRARIVAAYQRGGLTQREVALRHGIALSTLQRWLRQSDLGPPAEGPGLLEVPNLLGGAGPRGLYRLCFPRGVVLEVASGFAPEEVRALAEVVHGL